MCNAIGVFLQNIHEQGFCEHQLKLCEGYFLGNFLWIFSKNKKPYGKISISSSCEFQVFMD